MSEDHTTETISPASDKNSDFSYIKHQKIKIKIYISSHGNMEKTEYLFSTDTYI